MIWFKVLALYFQHTGIAKNLILHVFVGHFHMYVMVLFCCQQAFVWIFILKIIRYNSTASNLKIIVGPCNIYILVQ